MVETLLYISYPYPRGNWYYPEPISMKIINSNEANIIKLMCEKYPDFVDGCYIGIDCEFKLCDLKVVYIDDTDLVDAFKKMSKLISDGTDIYWNNEICSNHIYNILNNAVKKCYRMLIEKSIDDETDYDAESDSLELDKLIIHGDYILVDSLQSWSNEWQAKRQKI